MKLRKLAKFLGAVLALLILALVSIPFFISAEYLKAQLVAQVKEATGRELVIKGDASLTLFPDIAVRVEDATLGNPAGFSTPYFVRIAKLETGAALKPLLNKELRITGITLEGAEVNLEETASGAKNWEFPVEKAKEETKENLKKDAKSGSPLNDFALGDVTLKQSAVSYRKAGEKPLVAKDIDLTVSGADGSAPLKLDAKLVYQNEPVGVKLTVEKLLAALDGKATPLVADVSLPAASMSFKGVASMKDAPAAEGALNVAIADLPKLMGWATGKPAAAGTPKKIAVKTQLSLKGMESISLSDLTLAVDEVNATGKLAANLAGSVPAIKGALTLATLNLDTLGGKAGAGGGAAKAAPSATTTEGWSTDPIDLSALRSANADLTLAIGALKVSNLDISDINAGIGLKGGALKVDLIGAKLYGGTAKGVVNVDGSGNGVGIATDLALNGIRIEPLMVALSGKSRLEGTTSLTLALNGRGAHQRAIVNSLGGKGTLRVNDGAIKGINIANFLRSAKQGFLFAENSTASTDFTELAGSYTIAQGILSNNDLAMKSPVLRLAGSGTVNLPSRSLNYRLVPTLVGTIEGQGGRDASGIAVPLIITGPWSNPSVTPDVKGIIEEGLKNPEALKQNIKDIKGTLKNYNSPKDIGKALLGGQQAEQPAPAGADGAAAPAPAAKPSKEELIQQGIGGLLNNLGKK